MIFELIVKSCDNVGEDLWGVVGFIMGLGNFVSVFFRVGLYDVMCNIKVFFIFWII